MNKNKKQMKITVFVMATLMVMLQLAASNSFISKADSYTAITSYEGLLQIADDPTGNYVLMQDIDMKGKEWTPINFKGIFHGNGHSILNVSIDSTTTDTAVTYDGNMKEYDTYFAGFFGILDGATVIDLNIVNEKINITTDNNCFVGGIAGYSNNSTIDNCSITGNLNLSVNCKMFGIAGAVGFGNGSLDNSKIDVTLVCIDTNKEEKDEQFMGGALGAGYLNVGDCEIKIAGYDSDHGYVHDGGIIGMYIIYPAGTSYKGYVKNCKVDGFIRFFEDNTDRRAYCDPFIGEVMNWDVTLSGNKQTFKRDEVYNYTVDLKPEMCSNPHYTKDVVKASCTTFGYTIYTCKDCGYKYTDDYTLCEHHIEQWNVVTKATYDDYGIKGGTCTDCGEYFEEQLAKLVDVEACTMNAESIILNVNETYALEVTIAPEDADILNPEWKSSDESIVLVDANGNITALKNGTATISYSIDQGRVVSECAVVVNKQSSRPLIAITAGIIGILLIVLFGIIGKKK